MIGIIGGEEKKGKTTFAISFPKPMLYLEFDVGGFDRAKHRFNPEELAQIQLEQFPSPLKVEFKSKSNIESLKLFGEVERYQRFMGIFNTGCMDGSIKTIVMDTWFQTYELVRQAYLQTLQEAQLDDNGVLKKGEQKLRESLKPVEYTQPYSKLRSLMFYARAMKKHLVLVTYGADEYKPQLRDDGKIEGVKTGKKILAGWHETEKHADIALWCNVTDGKPGATITLAGLAPLSMVGTELPSNDYETLIQALQLGGVEVE